MMLIRAVSIRSGIAKREKRERARERCLPRENGTPGTFLDILYAITHLTRDFADVVWARRNLWEARTPRSVTGKDMQTGSWEWDLQ